MRPLKLCINVDAIDHFVYQGYLYVVLLNGGLIRISMNNVYSRLVEKYPHHAPLIQLAFRRNNFWNSDAAKCFLSIQEVKNALKKVWDKAAESVIFEVNLDELRSEVIISDIDDMILDIDLYNNYLLLAGRKGFYSIKLESTFNSRERRELKKYKIFDGKTYKIASSYLNSILSLGEDGLVASNLVNNEYIQDRNVNRNKVSFSSHWTAAGGLMNYSSPNDFQFIGNSLERSKESPEKFKIEKFDINFKDFNSLFSKKDNLTSKIEVGFNNRSQQFYLLSDGSLYISKVIVNKGNLSPLIPVKNSGVKLDYDNLGRPLSGLTVEDQLIIECDNSLVLIDNKKQYVIEEEGIVSMHSYPRSTHFRDIVTVTTEESINIHALNVLNYSNDLLFPPLRKYNAPF